MELSGASVVVTGAASGIGRACADKYAAAGASVIVTDIDDVAGSAAAANIGGVYRRLDVADPGMWDELTAEIATGEIGTDPGRLDLLHLNAGVRLGRADITELDVEEYLHIVGVNQHGVVYGMRACVPLLEAASGAVLVTASRASFGPLPFDPAYAMTKHAVAALVRSVAPDLAERGVSVNAICPATVDTGLLVEGARAWLEAAGMEVMEADEVADGAMAVLASGLTGECFVKLAGRKPEPFAFAPAP